MVKELNPFTPCKCGDRLIDHLKTGECNIISLELDDVQQDGPHLIIESRHKWKKCPCKKFTPVYVMIQGE